MNELPTWIQVLIMFGVPAAVLTMVLFLVCMIFAMVKIWRDR